MHSKCIFTEPALTQTTTTIDVRSIPPQERHPLIFTTFNKLATAQAIELVNDHDPQPLRAQFQELLPGRFAWTYLETGPTWRVNITKLEAPQKSGHCCGSCSGA